MFKRPFEECLTKIEKLCEEYGWACEFNMDSQHWELWPVPVKNMAGIFKV